MTDRNIRFLGLALTAHLAIEEIIDAVGETASHNEVSSFPDVLTTEGDVSRTRRSAAERIQLRSITHSPGANRAWVEGGGRIGGKELGHVALTDVHGCA